MKLLVNDKTVPCVKQICRLCVMCKASNGKTLSGETFCFHEKRLLSIIKFCAVSNFNIVFYELLIGPQSTFLECFVIFL